MEKNTTIIDFRRPLWILIIMSTLFRAFLAWGVELGNDEVYYRIFALFPSLSYFDHPPMVAWLVWLTTCGIESASELFVRLGPILIGAANTYIIYRIAGSGRSGFIASLLLTGSIYASLIVGTFIMPDSPLALFWLLALWMFKDILPRNCNENTLNDKIAGRKMLLTGLFIGLAMLSKYTGAYLWGAAGIYIILFNRKWLLRWELYISALISILVFLPVVIWNIQNDFISFTFHSARVTTETTINWLYFGREFLGGILYNNPINFILIICAICAYFKGRHFVDRPFFRLAIVFSLPFIILFLFISLTRETLPHWAAPGYFILIVLAARWLSLLRRGEIIAYSSALLLVFVGVLGYCQINHSLISLDTSSSDKTEQTLGRGDISLDMYGWKQLGRKFEAMLAEDQSNGLVGNTPQLFNYRWDESAHLDTYLATPCGLNLISLGSTYDNHFYDWINRWRGGLDLSKGGYLIVSSRYFSPDLDVFSLLEIDPSLPTQVIDIRRGNPETPVVNFFVYRISHQ